MKHRSFSYLRSHRKHWHLSEGELGELLGARQASQACRFETGERLPSGKVLLACEVIFGAAPREIFPGFYEQIEEAVMNRAAKLDERLRGKTDKRSLRKLELLADMMKRATKHRRA